MMNTLPEAYTISFDEQQGYVVMNWNGYATNRQFREGTELMLNVLIKHNASKVLGDIRDMVIIGMEDQQWLERDFLPRAIKFGFKAFAILKPTAHFNRVAVESVSFKVDKEKLLISFFDDIDEAKDWLVKIQS